jgi:hypothetical protein
VVQRGKKRYSKNLEEVKFLFNMLDEEAKRLQTWNDAPTRQFMVQMFYAAKHAWGISDKTPTGKKRNFEKMTFGSVLHLMPKEKKQRKK